LNIETVEFVIKYQELDCFIGVPANKAVTASSGLYISNSLLSSHTSMSEGTLLYFKGGQLCDYAGGQLREN
jgi:hypothetical protein